MTTQEVAKLTGYAGSTVRKYSDILQVKYYGIGRRKTYDWSDADVTRFFEAIRGVDGVRDQRGETQKKLKKMQKKCFGVLDDNLD